jgi:tryptophan 2,3-dioxygenase
MVKQMTTHASKHAPGESTYERYLRVPELLTLQKPEQELAHHDELLFQVVHQVFELWWKEADFELRAVRSLLQEYDVTHALPLMQRVIAIQHLMLANMRMLETMPPWNFHEFRLLLGDGAGTDSPGFHALMTISPLLLDDYLALLEHEGVTLVDVYTQGEKYPLLLAIAEALVDYDEVFQILRTQHFKMAQRMIGFGSVGTGGTPMAMLERTLKDAFYPQLWDVRNDLTRMADERGLK